MIWHFTDLHISRMNPLNDCFLRGLSEYHVSQEDGAMIASFTQALKRIVACWSVLDKRSRSIVTWQVGHFGTAWILLSEGDSTVLRPPWKFFCCISCWRILFHLYQIENWKNLYGVVDEIPSPERQDEPRDWTTYTAVALGERIEQLESRRTTF